MTDRRWLAGAALLAAALLAAPLLATQGGDADHPAIKPFVGPHVSGKVVRWNNYQIDLQTADGKTVQVAVNPKTERLVEIRKDEEVTVDYRRKIDKLIIALRIRPLEAAPKAAAAEPASATGTVVSSTSASLVLRTATGDVSLFLSPETEIVAPSVAPGRQVTVEYQTLASGSKLAKRVLAPKDGGTAAAPGKDDKGTGQPPAHGK